MQKLVVTFVASGVEPICLTYSSKARFLADFKAEMKKFIKDVKKYDKKYSAWGEEFHPRVEDMPKYPNGKFTFNGTEIDFVDVIDSRRSLIKPTVETLEEWWARKIDSQKSS